LALPRPNCAGFLHGVNLRTMSIGQDSRHVAIIDDDDSVRRALQDLIETEGLSTLCFASAEQFLDFEARHPAACVICDIRMPGMSGLDLQAKLKAERSHVPIIFITAHGNAELRTRALRDGAVEFLTKRFDDAVLLESVHAALEKSAHIDGRSIGSSLRSKGE
jgi:FixJ family two-component response regulator